MSAFPGATSLSKPKSRFGGLKKQGARPAKVESGFASGRALDSYMAHGSYRQTAHTLADHARRRRLHKGTPAIVFQDQRDPSHDRASIQRTPAAFRYAAAAYRQVRDGALRRAARR